MQRIGDHMVSDEAALLYEVGQEFLKKMNELNGNIRDLIDVNKDFEKLKEIKVILDEGSDEYPAEEYWADIVRKIAEVTDDAS